MIDQQKLKFRTLNYASSEVLCKPKGHYSAKILLFWVLGAFPHFGKTRSKSGTVFSAIWNEWVSGLCHRDQSPLGTQLRVETQPLQVTLGPKSDSPNVMINIR